MSTSLTEGYLKEAAILTRAVEAVFRKLIRLLMGRISLTRLQELVRLIFVQEAEAFLERETPGKNVPMTKLALLTGLDTRTLGKVKQDSAKGVPVHETQRFLREITPECSVLDYWQVNPRYLDNENNPLKLRVKGDSPSFDSLIAETLSSRGVTSNSILERLKASRAIEFDPETQTVEMLDKRYFPFNQNDGLATLEIGLISTRNLLDTIGHNLIANEHKKPSFFHRSTWTNRLPLQKRNQLRSVIRSLLTASEEKVTEILAEFEEEETAEDQVTAGVGLFYFEESSLVEE